MGDSGAEEITVVIGQFMYGGAVRPIQADFIIGICQCHAAAIDVVRLDAECRAVRTAEYGERIGSEG
jgi:hypothetical protein